MKSIQKSLQRNLCRLIISRTRTANIGEAGHGRSPVGIVSHYGCVDVVVRPRQGPGPSIMKWSVDGGDLNEQQSFEMRIVVLLERLTGSEAVSWNLGLVGPFPKVNVRC